MELPRLSPRIHLLTAILVAGSAGAQNNPRGPSCAIKAGVLRDIVLEDGRLAFVFPEALSYHADTLLLLGGGVISDPSGTPDASRHADSLVAGVLLAGPGHLRASIVPVPPALRPARSFRVRPRSDGWDVVFFVPDAGADSSWTRFENGALWYGRLRAGLWVGMERIGHIAGVVVLRPNTSELVMRDGRLHLALMFGDDEHAGGLIVWHRVGDGVWSADTVATSFGPNNVVSEVDPAGGGDGFYASVPQRLDAGSAWELLHLPAEHPSSTSTLRRSVVGSMNAPVLHRSGDWLHVSWWQGGIFDAPSLWYQALDGRRENASDLGALVAQHVEQFTFLAVPEDGGKRFVWVYPASDSLDLAEVAVVANGEPEVIGRMAFPFGFLTNGVSSGDRSFILATSPRPNPGAEPSASHILEVRVSCSEGT